MNIETHFILDLEAMGTGPAAAIAAIGCVCVKGTVIVHDYYQRVDLASAIAFDGTVDASTIQWWLKQSDKARAEVDGSQPSIGLAQALTDLAAWMITHEPNKKARKVWGNGSSFDCVILKSAYTNAFLSAPWEFWNDRDLRTLLALYPEAKQLPFEGIKHHALHDARHEAKQLIVALSLNALTARDSARLDWLSEPGNNICTIMLPSECVLANPGDLDSAIDDAMQLDSAALSATQKYAAYE